MAHSAEVLRAIENMAREGKSDPEIADLLGMSRHGVRAVRRRLGIGGQGKSPGTTGKDRFDWESVDWSQTNSEIARLLGCHHTAVSLRRKKR